jgi:hypothetical protein
MRAGPGYDDAAGDGGAGGYDGGACIALQRSTRCVTCMIRRGAGTKHARVQKVERVPNLARVPNTANH